MKKKYNVLLIIVCLFTFISSGVISLSNTIVTEKINYKATEIQDSASPMLTGEVKTRDLAILAALVYEDVPNDFKYKYKDRTTGGCLNKDGTLKEQGECGFSINRDKTLTEYEKNQLLNSKYLITTHIEGLSKRKMQSIISWLTATVEDGQEYYFLNYADERDYSSWKIYDYKSVREGDNNPDNVSWNNFFNAITFKKGNNYVIAFRGTDYPDVHEWGHNLDYAIRGGNHDQAKNAYKYARDVYKEIIAKDPTAKVYVTGHSLGGYLAQVAGAAIVDYDKYKDIENYSITAEPFQSTSLSEYTDKYSASSNLKQVAYFNGMGVSGIFANSDFAKNIDNALIYLATHKENGEPAKQGEICSTNNYVNYSDDVCSSGRLVLYSMEGDPVSDIGYHFGERYELEVGADALANHINQHDKVANHVLTGVVDALDYLKKVVTFIQDLFTNEDNTSPTKKTESLSDILYTIISDFQVKTDISNVPLFVKDQIGNTTYGLVSLLDMLIENSNYMEEKYGVSKVLDFANISHETDSFACIIRDNGTGYSGNGGSVSYRNTSGQINVYGGGDFYFSKNSPSSNGYTLEIKGKYEHPEKYSYKYNESPDIFYDSSKESSDNFLTLNLNIIRGCAKKYIYEYSLDYGNTWNKIAETYQKSIIITKDLIDKAANNSEYSNKIYIRAKIVYGDKYTELKLDKNSNILKYTSKDTKEFITIDGYNKSSELAVYGNGDDGHYEDFVITVKK